MNSKLALSIALTSVVTLNSAMAFADTPPETPVKAEASSQNGGKCAAGKCGTEKRFEKRELDSDPQDRLVSARDGKCGITGQGIKPTPERISDKNRKITEGVCGQ